MRGKRTAKNVTPVKEEEEYSVDEIATLLTGAKGRGKKAAVATPTVDEDVSDVAEVPAAKPKGRGKKAVAKVETAQETVAKKGKKGPVTADDEPQKNGDKVTKEIKTSNRRGQKVKENNDEASVPVKVTKGRGKKTTEEIENGDELAVPVPVKVTKGRGKKTPEVIENGDELAVPVPVKVTKGRGKKTTEVIENTESLKTKTRRGKTPINEENNFEETKPAKKAAAKRNNKKIAEEPKKEKVTQAKTKAVKKPAVEEIINPVTAKKARGNKTKSPPVEDVPTHITADESVPEAEVAEKKSRKRGAPKEAAIEEEAEPEAKKPLKNETVTNYDKEAFATKKEHTLKISTWNVAGMRSWLKKDGLKFLEYEQPDIFCLQEIKCEEEQLPKEAVNINGYHRYWLCMPGGYAGVAIYSRIMPIHVEYGIGEEEFDKNGRIITAEYEKFYLMNVYVPNSGRKLVNLDSRMQWEQLFLAHVQRYDEKKPVIICGDMNVSHQEIDLANPKSNTRNAGFTEEERDKMTQLLSAGFVDTFRHLYPDKIGAYTFWSYMGNARKRNVGWRLDYFITSQRILSRVVDQELRTQVLGSDHCTLTLFLNI